MEALIQAPALLSSAYQARPHPTLP